MNNQSLKNTSSHHLVHNLIIHDESYSMESIKVTTILGFNEVVQTIKGIERKFPEQKHYVSLGIKPTLFAKTAKNLVEIDENTFQPDAATPLYYVIGFSINKLRQKTGLGKRI